MQLISTNPDPTMTKIASSLATVFAMLVAAPAFARHGEAPWSVGAMAKSGTLVPTAILPEIDAKALRDLDNAKLQRADVMHDKRLAIATGNTVALNPGSSGQWQVLADGSSVWRMRVTVPGATDLHLGFETGTLPAAASLWVIGADDYYEGPYTLDDAMPLWIPMVPGNSATVEIRLPANALINTPLPSLTHVGAGFRDLFNPSSKVGQPFESGACNVNVVCPLGQPYTDEQRALAYYEFRAGDGNSYICTATLLNDVPADRKNYVLTAAHCMSTQSEAASMRVYWNYQSTDCAVTRNWSFSQNQTGASLRATRADADFTLVELNQSPNPDWNLFHAGWDADGVAPSASIGLHHPSGDVAKVDNSPTGPRSTYNCIGTGDFNTDTHWLTGPYNQGTTEGGSSGSGLFIPSADPSGHGRRLIGVLSGGNAQCAGTQSDNGTDCYGKLSAAWNGPAASSRLRDWLDPASSGESSISGIDHNAPIAPAIVGGLATRIAADRQVVPLRARGRGASVHPAPYNPLLRTN